LPGDAREERAIVFFPKTAKASSGRPTADPTRPPLPAVGELVLRNEDDRLRWARSCSQYPDCGLTDYYFGTSAATDGPDKVFPHLRWGGQLVFASASAREVEHMRRRYCDRSGYRVETPVQRLGGPRPRKWSLRRGGRSHYGFVARKTLLSQPDEATVRHSYDVKLEPVGDGVDNYVVVKQVPAYTDLVRRLRQVCPKAAKTTLQAGARKLVDKVFPLFLTREAAILKIIQRDVPAPYCHRMPRVLEIEKDDRGFVQKMQLNWLRQGGVTLSQIEFARQSLDLLHVLHERGGMIHLDLRLDNLLVTDSGVGFVDFGSSVRVGEDFSRNAILRSLFTEMLSTSQIQKDLKNLLQKGKVTSRLFTNCCQKMDKAVDLFYMVLQMNKPHLNPDFRGLVHYDPQGEQAAGLSKLCRSVMRPTDPERPGYRSAWDVLCGIRRLERDLGN